VVYVQNVDEAFEHALKEGATAIRKPKDQFYGDRSCVIRDPFGHVWNLQTHVEDVTPEDMKKRMAAMSGCGEGPAEKKTKNREKSNGRGEIICDSTKKHGSNPAQTAGVFHRQPVN